MRGLAGELVFILCMPNISDCLDAWRLGDADTHDFVFRHARLDVKATATKQRRHFVTFDQVQATGNEGYFASLFISESGTGVTGNDLVELIRQRGLTAKQRHKVEANVANALGSSIREWQDYRLDVPLAMESLAVYRAAEIPAVRSRPPGVTQLKFRSDFSLADAVESSKVAHLLFS
jgi:hypothetical protein